MTPVSHSFRYRLDHCPIWVLWIAAVRPHLLLPAWAAAATGVAWTAAQAGSSLTVTDGNFWTAWIAWSASLAAVQLINLTVDLDSDAINAKNCFWRSRPPYAS